MRDAFTYPIYLSLEGKRCLVIGFGNVGQRKAAGLLQAGASEIVIIDKCSIAELPEGTKALLANSEICYQSGEWRARDVEKAFLVFACVNDAAENLKIASICKQLGKLCNSVTDPEAGDFIVPALAKRSPLSCAISTGAASPYLAGKLKNEVSEILKPYQLFAIFMSHLRDVALQTVDSQTKRKAFFASLYASPLPDLLFAGNFDDASVWIMENLAGKFQTIALTALGEISR